MYERRVLSSVDSAWGRANVADFRWPPQHRSVNCASVHRIGLSLSPVPLSSRARFRVDGCAPCAVGPIVFAPSAIPMEAGNGGGFQRIATCEFTPAAFRELAGHDPDWTLADLRRSMDVRSQRLDATLKRLAQEVVAPGLGSGAAVEALMSIVAIDLMRHLRGTASDDPSLRVGGLSPRNIGLIEARIRATDLPLPSAVELAGIVGLSSRHLLRGYRHTMGETLRERLQRETGERARILLSTTDLPLKAVAHLLGFGSQSSFSTAFRNTTGMTPSAYRRAPDI